LIAGWRESSVHPKKRKAEDEDVDEDEWKKVPDPFFYRADSASDEPVEDTLRGLPGLLERLAGLKTLALVPDDPANDVRAGRLAKIARFAIDQAQWGKIIGQGKAPRRN